MDPVAQAALLSWNWRPEVIITLTVLAVLFLVGWQRLRRRSRRTGWTTLGAAWRPVSYIAGLLVIALALLSPIEVLVQYLFFMHMIQHLLLIAIAPILLLLPNPMPYLLWGLPNPLRIRVGGVVNTIINKETTTGRWLRKATGPAIVWFLFVGIIIGWHDPSLYNAALQNETIHDLEHMTMFFAGMIYWWTVTGAGPRLHKNLGRLPKIAFSISAIPPNMALGVVLAFSSTVIYSYYNDMPRLWGISPLDDQRISGIIMWIPGSMMHFMAALILIFLMLSGEQRKPVEPQSVWTNNEELAAPGITPTSSTSR
jgi:putative membrane protein